MHTISHLSPHSNLLLPFLLVTFPIKLHFSKKTNTVRHRSPVPTGQCLDIPMVKQDHRGRYKVGQESGRIFSSFWR